MVVKGKIVNLISNTFLNFKKIPISFKEQYLKILKNI